MKPFCFHCPLLLSLLLFLLAVPVRAQGFFGTTTLLPFEIVVNNERVVRLEPGTATDGPNVIMGWSGNIVALGVVGATISGGGADTPLINRVDGNYGAVGGGFQNTASGTHATVGGGQTNTASGDNATIAGGFDNTASNSSAAVGGGFGNTVSNDYATIGGGFENTANGDLATIGGGDNNRASGTTSTVGGGSSNTASGTESVVSGGDSNTADGNKATIGGGQTNTASDDNATIGGGFQNTVSGGNSTVGGGQNNTATGASSTIAGGALNAATGFYSTVPGGVRNAARGRGSFAAGEYAKALHDGVFVWSDNSQPSSDSLFSTAENQFLIRAIGGVGIGTNAPLVHPGLHLRTASLSMSEAALTNEDLLVESGDAVLGLYSSNGGNFGSALTLGQITNSSLTTKWTLVRRTSTGGNTLQFRYGTDPDYSNNAVVMEIDGDSGGKFVQPGTSEDVDLGQSSRLWKAVYALNGTIQTSDVRLKQDVENLRYGLSEVMLLRPVQYRWKNRPSESVKVGLIAQEVAEVVPEVVQGTESSGPLGMNYGELVPVLIKAVQMQQGEIEALKARLAALEALLVADGTED